MPNSPSQPYILVPEVALLADLPEHQRKRFETALDIIHNDLSAALSWEQVAQQSAISPFHFHRQFTRLFHETPGHYLGRVRLQYAVSLLLECPNKKIIDIAMQSGFSSSQAMAKALKRSLNLTAKAIKELGFSGTEEQTNYLLEALAHQNGGDSSVEMQLAEKMPCELKAFPTRRLQKVTLPDLDWETLCEKLGSKMKQIVFATPIPELDKPWNESLFTAGKWIDAKDKSPDSVMIPAGHYLCCEVYIVSDIGYIAALDGLFLQAEKLGYDVIESRQCIEQSIDFDWRPTGGMVLSIQLPVVG